MVKRDIESQLLFNRRTKKSYNRIFIIISTVSLFLFLSGVISVSLYLYFKSPSVPSDSSDNNVEVTNEVVLDKRPNELDKPKLEKEIPLPEKPQHVEDPLKPKEDLDRTKEVKKNEKSDEPVSPEPKVVQKDEVAKPDLPEQKVVKEEKVTKPKEVSDKKESPKEDIVPKEVKVVKDDKAPEEKEVHVVKKPEEETKKEQHDTLNKQNKIPVSEADSIFERMKKFVTEKGMKVVPGTAEECAKGTCEKPEGEHVYEWQLREISDFLKKNKTEVDLDKEYENLKMYQELAKKYSRNYKQKKEYHASYSNFYSNKTKVETNNKDPKRTYDMELNIFWDVTMETSSLALSYYPTSEGPKSGLSSWENDLENQEIHVDWRKEGVVLPVINQGECGSCWAVASVDVLNTFRAIKKKDKRRFSYQQLVDCVSPKYNCVQGGNQVKGLHYIKDKKICTYDEYPYVRKKDQCSDYKCGEDTEITNIETLDQSIALDFLKKNGPFLTLFYVSTDFLLYKQGVFNGSCKGHTAHSVVVVGHGHDKVLGMNYWIVKNSWGEEWGDQGYFRILDEPRFVPGGEASYCDFTYHAYGVV